MERQCYVEIRDLLFGGDANPNSGIVRDLTFMLIDGKAGVGKGCYAAWLMYDIFRRALHRKFTNCQCLALVVVAVPILRHSDSGDHEDNT